jgi:hypothetical protein
MSDFRQSLKYLLQEGLDHKIISHKELVYAACQVVRTVLYLIPEGENRPRIAIETTERWCRGEASLEEVNKAVDAAYAAADAAYAAAAYAAAASAAAAAPAAAATSAAAAAPAAPAAAASYAAGAAYYAAFDVDYNTDISKKQNEIKQLMLSHLPKLQKWKVWL